MEEGIRYYKELVPIKIKFMGDPEHIPSKREEDAGYDIYTTEKGILLAPGETHIFATGIYSSFPSGYWIEIKERGSTAKYGLSIRSGVIDSGYRGEWFIAITNCTCGDWIGFNWTDEEIRAKEEEWKIHGGKLVFYPFDKAIAQAVLQKLPCSEIEIVDEIDLDSERGAGKCGSSGK